MSYSYLCPQSLAQTREMFADLKHTLEIVQLNSSFPGGDWIISQGDKLLVSGRAGLKVKFPFPQSKLHVKFIL